MKAIFKIPKALSYKGDKRNWNKFKQNFDIYMKATGLVDNESENKVNIFLNIAGEEALEIYNNLKLNAEEKNNFDRVIEAFEEYISSKHNVIYKSFKFFTRIQQPGEFFIDFYNDLQVMADFCNFGDQKDRLIRDRIIVGIKNTELQQNFLKAPDLSLEEVVNKCVDDEVKKINGHFKMEIVSDETVNEQELVDEETNNNYEELLNNEANVEEFTLDQIHVPDEILFNDMAAEEEVTYEVVEEATNVQIEENDIDIEESNVNEYISVEKGITQDEGIDIKPMSIQPNSTNRRVRIKRNEMQSTTSMKKEKLLQRIKKAEVIRKKIAEIKEKLCNDIKREVDSEQMGICQKLTRSRVKQFSVMNEQQSDCPEKAKDRIKKEIFIQNLENELEDEEEDEDPYACEDDPDYVINTREELRIFQDYDEVEVEMVNRETANEDVDGKAISEMAQAEYLEERQSTSQESFCTSSPKLEGKRRKSNTEKKVKVEFLELKRENLPPLFVKTVKNKTLLVGKMPYPCKKCDSSFWTSLQLERHQLVHVLKKVAPTNSTAPKKVFKCEVCSKEFKKICDLERHTRVHTGEKPSVCNICNKRFQQAYNLHKHLLTHTQEKNFECVICQKRFGRNDVLNRHVLTHSIDKPYHCWICMKTFIRNSQLKLHLRKHHGMSASEANAAAAEKDANTAAAETEAGPAPSTTIQEDADDPVAGTSSG